VLIAEGVGEYELSVFSCFEWDFMDGGSEEKKEVLR
jgi:hypothetical protein